MSDLKEYARLWRIRNAQHVKEYRRAHNTRRRITNRKWKKKYRARFRDSQALWREKNRERIRDYHRKWSRGAKRKRTLWRKAWSVTWVAIRSGRLVRPNACSKCGKDCIPHAHHEDYNKPLEIIWLCQPCHNRITHCTPS